MIRLIFLFYFRSPRGRPATSPPMTAFGVAWKTWWLSVNATESQEYRCLGSCSCDSSQQVDTTNYLSGAWPACIIQACLSVATLRWRNVYNLFQTHLCRFHPAGLAVASIGWSGSVCLRCWNRFSDTPISPSRSIASRRRLPRRWTHVRAPERWTLTCSDVDRMVVIFFSVQFYWWLMLWNNNKDEIHFGTNGLWWFLHVVGAVTLHLCKHSEKSAGYKSFIFVYRIYHQLPSIVQNLSDSGCSSSVAQPTNTPTI